MLSFKDIQSLFKIFIVKHKFLFWAFIICLVFLISKAFLGHRTSAKEAAKKNAKPAPSVLISSARREDIPVYITALGSVVPDRSVVIKTQINGQLLKVLFQEGQLVEAGDLLAEIDPRPYEAQLLQYEGQLAKDLALLKNAKKDHERYKNLVLRGAISSQTLDTQKSLVQQYEGTVKSDQGLVDSARLNRTYCDIKTPIAGKVGIRQVDPGNYVQVTDPNGIVIVNSVDPVFVVFSIPQDSLQKVAQRMKEGDKLKVDAFDREQNHLLGTGILSTIDNQIDNTTGSVKLKAHFDNENNRFFPNQFVNVRLLIETQKGSKIIPTSAIQHSPTGSFVYKVQKNNTVKVVPVEVKTVNGDDTAIIGDIKLRDYVVIDGTDKLNDGIPVKVTEKKLVSDIPSEKSSLKSLAENKLML